MTKIPAPLLAWFDQNKRDLPWRHDITPYRVWVSEIMLQQTRVEAVKPYFDRFMKELPDIPALAACPEDKLLKLWEGLGYYNRVRNMQAAAQTILSEYDGQMPRDLDTILKLKGIGSYTAAAIASIAFGIPAPAVDGNVLRVVMRLAGDDSDIMKQTTKRRVEDALAPVIPEDSAREFTTAMIEIGAIVCTPNGTPKCEACPLAFCCRSKADGGWQRRPVKKKAPARRIEERSVLIIRDGAEFVLQKRPRRGLLAGLYELPNLEGFRTQEEIFSYVEALGLEPLHIRRVEDAKHIFSHVEWHMQGYLIQVAAREEPCALLFAAEDDHPIPSAFQAYKKYLFPVLT